MANNQFNYSICSYKNVTHGNFNMLFHYIHDVQGIIFAAPGFQILEYQLVSVGVLSFILYTVYIEVCVLKPLQWLMQFRCNNYFENATIVAYVGLKVKWQ